MHQYFIITRYNEAKDEIVDTWVKSRDEIFDVESKPYANILNRHKATKEELVKHFKQE